MSVIKNLADVMYASPPALLEYAMLMWFTFKPPGFLDREEDFREDKTAAKERRLELCSSLDNKALLAFPAANLLFNIIFWAYFLS